MPLYEYECEKCHCHFDLRQSFKESAEATCPECQGKARRVFSPVPIIFKGSGFYVTDNRTSVSNSGSSNANKSKPQVNKDSSSKEKSAPSGTAPSKSK